MIIEMKTCRTNIIYIMHTNSHRNQISLKVNSAKGLCFSSTLQQVARVCFLLANKLVNHKKNSNQFWIIYSRDLLPN